MSLQKESEWEKIWEKFVLHDAVLAVVASPVVGGKFDVEKFNYANQKLNALTGYIYTRGKNVVQEILSTRENEIAEEVEKVSFEDSFDGQLNANIYRIAFTDDVLKILKH